MIKSRSLSYDLVSCTYLCLASIFCHILDIPPFLKSCLALPTLLVVPQLIGDLTLWLLRAPFYDLDIFSKYIVEYLFGLMTLFTSILVFINVTRLSLDYYILSLFILIFLGIFYRRIRRAAISSTKERLKSCLGNYLILPVLLVLGILPAINVKIYQPFPLVDNPAVSSFIFETLQLTDGKIFYVSYGHIPVIPALTGFTSELFNIHPLFLYHVAPYLMYLIYPLGIYLLSYRLSGKMSLSLLASFIGCWPILGTLDFNSFMTKGFVLLLFPYILYVFSVFLKEKTEITFKMKNIITFFSFTFIVWSFLFFQKFLLPITMKNVAIILLVSLVILLSKIIRNAEVKSSYLLISIATLAISMVSAAEAVFFFVALYSFVLSFKIISHRKKYFLIFYCSLLTLFFVFVFTQMAGIVVFQDNFVFSRRLWGNLYDSFWFNMDFQQKYGWYVSANSALLHIIFYLGMLLILIIRDFKSSPIAVSGLTCLFLFFLPEGHFWRVASYTNVALAYCISFVVLYPLTFLNRTKHLKPKFDIGNVNLVLRKNRAVKLLYIMIALLVILATMVDLRKNYIQAIAQTNSEGYFSYMTLTEVNAALWLYGNTPKMWINPWLGDTNVKKIVITIHDPTLGHARELTIPLTNDTLIISDPYTMFLMNGLTGRDQAIDERVFIYEEEYAPEALQQMKNIKEKIFMANSSEAAYKEIQKVKREHSVVLIVLSEKTYWWSLSDNTFILFTQTHLLHDSRLLELFDDERFFQLVYNIEGEIYIFSVKNKTLQ